MRRPVGAIVANVLGVALFGWLYGGDVALWAHVRSAPVSAFVEPPGLAFPVVALLVTAGGLGVLAVGLLRGRAGEWKGYRLFPIAAVVVLFVDFGVLSSVKVSMSSADRALIAVQIVSDFASASTQNGLVPAEAKALEPVLPRLGPVPWLVRGEQLAGWRVDVRTCEGPAGDTRGQPPGTVIYCVAADRSKGWVTIVGLPVDAKFGEPAVVSTDAAFVGTVAPPRPRDPDEEGAEDGDLLPTPPNEADSGR